MFSHKYSFNTWSELPFFEIQPCDLVMKKTSFLVCHTFIPDAIFLSVSNAYMGIINNGILNLFKTGRYNRDS